MGEGEKVNNALGVSRKAEAELIGIALRYELHSGVRLNWMIDTEQCIGVLNLLVDCGHPELKNRAARFYEALDDDEKNRLQTGGLILPIHRNDETASTKKSQMIYRGQKVT